MFVKVLRLGEKYSGVLYATLTILRRAARIALNVTGSVLMDANSRVVMAPLHLFRSRIVPEAASDNRVLTSL